MRRFYVLFVLLFSFSPFENGEIGREGMKAPLLRRQSVGDAGGCRMKAHRLW